ncbi:hypothetical protein SNEBB_003021 [Seison nebaliae]|nr:hypothetical protein SNEBB_003021 [Seison nebaliae]
MNRSQFPNFTKFHNFTQFPNFTQFSNLSTSNYTSSFPETTLWYVYNMVGYITLIFGLPSNIITILVLIQSINNATKRFSNGQKNCLFTRCKMSDRLSSEESDSTSCQLRTDTKKKKKRYSSSIFYEGDEMKSSTCSKFSLAKTTNEKIKLFRFNNESFSNSDKLFQTKSVKPSPKNEPKRVQRTKSVTYIQEKKPNMQTTHNSTSNDVVFQYSANTSKRKYRISQSSIQLPRRNISHKMNNTMTKKRTVNRSRLGAAIAFELFLLEIAVLDLILLFIYWARVFPWLRIDFSSMMTSLIRCQTMFICMRSFTSIRNWLLVSFTIQRTIAIMTPFGTRCFRSPCFSSSIHNTSNIHRAVLYNILIVLFSTLISILITSSITLNYMNFRYGHCHVLEENSFVHNNIYIILCLLIPCLLLILFNLVTYFLAVSPMASYHRSIGKHSPIHTSLMGTAYVRKLSRTTSLLLLLSFFYILMYMPYSLTFLITTQSKSNRSNVNFFLRESLSNIKCLTHIFNFYIYILSGARFRRELKRMFLCS